MKPKIQMLIGVCGAVAIMVLSISKKSTAKWSSDSDQMLADIASVLIDISLLAVYIFGIIRRKLKVTRIAFHIWFIIQAGAVIFASSSLLMGDEDFVRDPMKLLRNVFWIMTWVFILWQGLRGLEKVVDLEDKSETKNVFIKNLINSQSVSLFLISLSAGILLGALISFVKGHKSDSAKPIRSGIFGDITATIEERHQSEPNGSIAELNILSIDKKGFPWLIVHKTLSDDVNEITLPILGTGKLIAAGIFQGNKMTEFNIIKDDGQMNFFEIFRLRYDQQRKKWGEGVYIAGAADWTPGSRASMDIDFDGQLDAESVTGSYKKFVSNSIYIDGIWQKVDWVAPQDRKASLKVDNEKIHYEFIDGKGWKRQDANKPVTKEIQ